MAPRAVRMKRVLIITYYWPPNGGAGVYRWLKFSKYLPEHGWQPVIYTPENPESVADDPGLLRDVRADIEVIKHPITEPFNLYKRFTGRGRNEKVQVGFLNEKKQGGWKEDLALWVRSNFFIPDARVWWVRPSIAFLKNYLREHPVDVIITTGPPHSMHLIGLGLKRALGVKWIADFRDPWTDIDFYEQLSLTRWADARHKRLERSVLRSADRVVTVSWHWAEDLQRLGGRPVEVITNGFDPHDVPKPAEPVDDAYSLVHIGSLSPSRNAPELWRALRALCDGDPAFAAKFKLRFVGPVDHTVAQSVADAGLGDHLERIGRVDHDEAMRHMQRARVLLLLVNDTPNLMGILPGKVFEYLSVGRPILAIGPVKGDVARVLADASHLVIDRAGTISGQSRIKQVFNASPANTVDIYSRRGLTMQVAELLGTVAEA
ncbi:MAG: glycosyltransferase [Flavobacteriales bacterium]|jgi:glycosyltransferase involved in cell wall biosynthesis|nr:glycosyltransferase [Flavobacteriales bacterium]